MRAVELPPTPRQREILALVAAGQRNGQIAARLGISIETVTCQLHDVYQRLGVANLDGRNTHTARTRAAIWHYREVALERAAGRR